MPASAVANIEIFQAGSGNDVLALNGYTTPAIILGGLGDDIAFGGSLNDIVLGSGGNDFLDGGLGSDQIFGESDSDTLIASLGNDFLDGGAGIDTIQFAPGVTLASLLNVEVISASTIFPAGLLADSLVNGETIQDYNGGLLVEYTNFNGMTSAFVARNIEAVVLNSTTYSPTAFVNAANGNTHAVPEPSTFLLLGSGLAGLISWQSRKRPRQ